MMRKANVCHALFPPHVSTDSSRKRTSSSSSSSSHLSSCSSRHDESYENHSSTSNVTQHPTPSLAGSSVPNSPMVRTRNRSARTTPMHSTPNTPHHSLVSTKKPKTACESTRPTLFQRLFGVRSSSSNVQPLPIPIVIESSPLISPLTVTLDSHDDLMPLTTSSTASSASGRASSSGYESMSNTAFEEVLSSIPNTVIHENNLSKLRTKSIRKGSIEIHFIFTVHWRHSAPLPNLIWRGNSFLRLKHEHRRSPRE